MVIWPGQMGGPAVEGPPRDLLVLLQLPNASVHGLAGPAVCVPAVTLVSSGEQGRSAVAVLLD